MKINYSMLSLAFSLAATQAHADEKNITVSSEAVYANKNTIASNIIDECTDLPLQFSNSTKKYLEGNGWKVAVNKAPVNVENETSLTLHITHAISAGNAFTGHRKSVSVKAELYEQGKLVDTFSGTRNSGGGFGAGFKGSCSVLHRCVNTLGNDVSKWLNKK